MSTKAPTTRTKLFGITLFLLVALTGCEGALDYNPREDGANNRTSALAGVRPSDGERIRGDSVELVTSDSEGAWAYEFELEYHDGHDWRNYYTWETDGASKRIWPVVDDAAYRWRARARSNAGWSGYTRWNVFVFGDAEVPDGAIPDTDSGGDTRGPADDASNSSPPSVSARRPSDGATISGDSVELASSRVDGARRYLFETEYYSGNRWRDYYTWETRGPSKRIWPAVDDAAYRWRIKVHTAAGDQLTSSWKTFAFGHAHIPGGSSDDSGNDTGDSDHSHDHSGSGGGCTSGSPAACILDDHQADEVSLYPLQVSGVDGEDASALDNIRDAAAGRRAQHSCYGNAPCRSTYLSTDMLQAMLTIHEDYGMSFRVTSIAGGSHSVNSAHYDGVAFDVDKIDGVKINGVTHGVRELMQACRDLGATNVLGPTNHVGHDSHIHCRW